jgi:anaerobic magnesium-protoporphyrin IX monomethyl ester cyclase
MKVALINPNWRFQGSISFGCREPHLPLEYGYAARLLESAGHESLIIDGQMEDLGNDSIKARVAGFNPDYSVITTAPSYLFWGCAPPELRVPNQLLKTLRDGAGVTVVIGPHVSTTPGAAMRKLQTDAGILGGPEEMNVRRSCRITSSNRYASSACERMSMV